MAGADAENKAAVERAQAFLLKTQLPDGSWWVVSREKGRKSLASSFYGSAWATLGLIRTLQPAPAHAQQQRGSPEKAESTKSAPGDD